MKFRRHGGKGFHLGALFAWLKTLPKRYGIGDVVRRFAAWIGPVGGKRRSRFVAVSAMITAFLAGYVIAATILFPAPIFPRSQDVPRLFGMSLAEASEALENAGLAVADTERVSHPEIPFGQIVWQDPPPGVAVPEGVRVSLSVSRGPRPVQVPDVTGYERNIAIQLVEAAGLAVARVDTIVAPAERGVVVRSSPPAGRSLNPGSGVGLFVSVGPPTIRIPDVTGLTVEEAQVLLEEAGFVLGTTTVRTTNIHEPNLVFVQFPAEGTLSAPGTAVNVTVARGG